MVLKRQSRQRLRGTRFGVMVRSRQRPCGMRCGVTVMNPHGRQRPRGMR